MGFSAAALAVDDASLDSSALDPDRLGVVYGTEMLYCGLDSLADVFRDSQTGGEFQHELFGELAQAKMYPLWMLRFLPNMTACHVGIAYDGRGPNNTIVEGDASSLIALSECVGIMRRGMADVMIAGGVGNRLSPTLMAYRGELTLSRRVDDPAGACRPFAADRDGVVNGEGSAAFILETRSHAEARGAKPLAQICGYGNTFEDRQHGRKPTGDGVRSSMQVALSSAGIDIKQIDHVNAHGMSSIDEDRAEAQAIRDICGDVPVTAPKSLFGNLGAGGGAVELAASVLALSEGQTPFTLNYQSPDPDCPINVIAGAAKPVEKSHAMALSQSIGGQTSAIVISAEN